MKTALILVGIVLVLAIAFLAYACVVAGGRAEREMFSDDREE